MADIRIIGGQWRRSKLPVLSRPGLRPTPDRVRETLFNWLGQDLTGWRCLDAFAGSGALGFEAASRGAAQVTLIEQDAGAIKSLQSSIDRLKAAAVMQVQRADAIGVMSRMPPAQWELVFLDPPFSQDLWGRAMEVAVPLLVPHGFLYVESPQPLSVAWLAERSLSVYRNARAGAVHYHLLQTGDGV